MTDAQLRALLAAHDHGARCHDDQLAAACVLAHFDIDFEGDGAPDGGPSKHDDETRQLADMVVALMRTVQRMTDAMVTT